MLKSKLIFVVLGPFVSYFFFSTLKHKNSYYKLCILWGFSQNKNIYLEENLSVSIYQKKIFMKNILNFSSNRYSLVLGIW